MKVVGKPEIIVEDYNPLPAEEDLVTFSSTLSASDVSLACRGRDRSRIG